MSVVAEPPVVETSAGVTTPPPAVRDRVELWGSFLLDMRPGESASLLGLSWADYERLLAIRDGHRPGVRLVYDNGRLSIMSVGGRHEAWKSLIAHLLTAVAVGFRVPRVGAGNLTIRRESLQRGFEPDDCYYIQRAAGMRLAFRRDIDFETDPPPDLAVEVEMTRDATGKLPLYAAMQVPEVWRWDGERLSFLHLSATGEYAEQPVSRAFPALTRDLLASYLGRAETVDDTTLFLELQAWADAARTNPTPPETA